MSTLKPTRKISRRHELREDRVVTASTRVIDAARTNQSVLTMAAIAAIILIAAFFGFRYYKGQQEIKAAETVASAVRAYEQGLYRESLDGVAGSMGLTAIVDRFGSTPTGNLARFYAGDAHFRLGELDAALDHFRGYKKSQDYIGASAYAGEAAILESRGDHDKAASLYERAAEVFESDLTTPQYLLNAAIAFESGSNYSRATDMLERIKDDFPDSAAAGEVDLILARVSAKEAAS